MQSAAQRFLDPAIVDGLLDRGSIDARDAALLSCACRATRAAMVAAAAAENAAEDTAAENAARNGAENAAQNATRPRYLPWSPAHASAAAQADALTRGRARTVARVPRAHGAAVTCAAACGHVGATGGRDGACRVWDLSRLRGEACAAPLQALRPGQLATALARARAEAASGAPRAAAAALPPPAAVAAVAVALVVPRGAGDGGRRRLPGDGRLTPAPVVVVATATEPVAQNAALPMGAAPELRVWTGPSPGRLLSLGPGAPALATARSLAFARGGGQGDGNGDGGGAILLVAGCDDGRVAVWELVVVVAAAAAAVGTGAAAKAGAPPSPPPSLASAALRYAMLPFDPPQPVTALCVVAPPPSTARARERARAGVRGSGGGGGGGGGGGDDNSDGRGAVDDTDDDSDDDGDDDLDGRASWRRAGLGASLRWGVLAAGTAPGRATVLDLATGACVQAGGPFDLFQGAAHHPAPPREPGAFRAISAAVVGSEARGKRAAGRCLPPALAVSGAHANPGRRGLESDATRGLDHSTLILALRLPPRSQADRAEEEEEEDRAAAAAAMAGGGPRRLLHPALARAGWCHGSPHEPPVVVAAALPAPPRAPGRPPPDWPVTFAALALGAEDLAAGGATTPASDDGFACRPVDWTVVIASASDSPLPPLVSFLVRRRARPAARLLLQDDGRRGGGGARGGGAVRGAAPPDARAAAVVLPGGGWAGLLVGDADGSVRLLRLGDAESSLAAIGRASSAGGGGGGR